MGSASNDSEASAPASGDADRLGSVLLQVENVSRRFGGVQAVVNLSLEIRAGEIVGLIGPNGSGKSTCVNLFAGQIRPTSGRILFEAEDVTRQAPDARVRLGLARTFQATSLFTEFTALENVQLGAHVCSHASTLRRTHANAVLDFVGLASVADRPAAELSSAQQRLLMIGLALASQPSLVMLDEPAAGMVAQERRELASLIGRIRAAGTAVLVIEHHMGLIMEVCDRLVVLNFGQTIAYGSCTEVTRNPAVIDAYLGRAH